MMQLERSKNPTRASYRNWGGGKELWNKIARTRTIYKISSKSEGKRYNPVRNLINWGKKKENENRWGKEELAKEKVMEKR